MVLVKKKNVKSLISNTGTTASPDTAPQKKTLGLATTFCLIPQLLSQACIGQKSYQFSVYN